MADTPLGEVIERLETKYRSARKEGIWDWDYRDFMAQVTVDWPRLFAALQAGQEYVEAWKAAERDWWPDDDPGTALAVYKKRLALLAAYGKEGTR